MRDNFTYKMIRTFYYFEIDFMTWNNDDNLNIGVKLFDTNYVQLLNLGIFYFFLLIKSCLLFYKLRDYILKKFIDIDQNYVDVLSMSKKSYIE